jgi:hypothetical protein
MAAQAFEGKETPEDFGQPLRRPSDTVLFDQYLELALELVDPRSTMVERRKCHQLQFL